MCQLPAWRQYLPRALVLSVALALAPLPSLDTLGGLRAAIAQLVVDVYEGRVDPRRAAGMMPLLNSLLRVSEAAEMEVRMASLEKQVEELQASPSEPDFEENSDPVN